MAYDCACCQVRHGAGSTTHEYRSRKSTVHIREMTTDQCLHTLVCRYAIYGILISHLHRNETEADIRVDALWLQSHECQCRILLSRADKEAASRQVHFFRDRLGANSVEMMSFEHAISNTAGSDVERLHYAVVLVV